MTEAMAQAVADKILGAYATRTPEPPVRELLPAGATDQAYAALEFNTERWLAEGRKLVGRKIGLTSLAVQRQLGVSQPDYGMLFADMAVLDGWDVAADQLAPLSQPARGVDLLSGVGLIDRASRKHLPHRRHRRAAGVCAEDPVGDGLRHCFSHVSRSPF